MHLDISIADVKISALVDTGSQKTIFRESTHKRIGSPSLQTSDITLTGLGTQVVHPIGYFNHPFKIDNTIFQTDVYVVNNAFLSFDAIIGQDSLQQAEFSIGKNGISLITNHEEQNFFVNFNVLDQNISPDLTHISNDAIMIQVSELTTSYKPLKTKSTDLKMTIVLSDDIPVIERPRRLPKVEQQIVDKKN
ncbi:hypothetical protein AVEN_214302-1 [Araneus ventricosus]|uniref:Peptidase A2 domain-containing protein n=1 Tax=Araneus ventricosus TaxID=182803 RepID=A0A4Y2J964_ARAVE|nr:hypothetical protein AVEN_214302-1 [Araneus ventricosus]